MIDVIPAIDIIDGACVRLSKGDYSTKTVYEKDPVEMAKRFEGVGIGRLHLVDLDGARTGTPKNVSVLEAITQATSLIVDFGGGIKSADDLDVIQSAGAAQVSIGSVAVRQPEVVFDWIERFGTDFFIVCADAKEGKIALHGWQEVSDFTIVDFITAFYSKGIRHFLCTNIEKDGMLTGVDLPLYRALMQQFSDMYLIASGGVSCVDDIEELATSEIPAVVVGKAFYEGRISLEQLGAFYAK